MAGYIEQDLEGGGTGSVRMNVKKPGGSLIHPCDGWSTPTSRLLFSTASD